MHMTIKILVTAAILFTSCGKVQETKSQPNTNDSAAANDLNNSDPLLLTDADKCQIQSARDAAVSCVQDALSKLVGALSPKQAATKFGNIVKWVAESQSLISKLISVAGKLTATEAVVLGQAIFDDSVYAGGEKQDYINCYLELRLAYGNVANFLPAIDTLIKGQNKDPISTATAMASIAGLAINIGKLSGGACAKILTPELQKKISDLSKDALTNLGLMLTVFKCGLSFGNGAWVIGVQTIEWQKELEQLNQSNLDLISKKQQCLKTQVSGPNGCARNFGIYLGMNPLAKNTYAAQFCAKSCATNDGNKYYTPADKAKMFAGSSVQSCPKDFTPGQSCVGAAVDICVSQCCGQNSTCVEAAQKDPVLSQCKSACTPGKMKANDCSNPRSYSVKATQLTQCNEMGTGSAPFGSCIIDQCAAGYTKDSAGTKCVFQKTFCTPGKIISTKSCSMVGSAGGSQTTKCNATGSAYETGACITYRCNGGYNRTADGACVSQQQQQLLKQQVCKTGEYKKTECHDDYGHGSGYTGQFCNSQNTGFDSPTSCILTSCDDSYAFVDGQCQDKKQANACTPRQLQWQPCVPAEGTTGWILATCNDNGVYATGANTCQATVCNEGLPRADGSCVDSTVPTCASGSILVSGACTVIKPTCDTNYTLTNGVCTLIQPICLLGYTLTNGVCTKPADACTPSQQDWKPCGDDIGTGSIFSTCKSDGSGYETGANTCQYATCKKSQYIAVAGKCQFNQSNQGNGDGSYKDCSDACKSNNYFGSKGAYRCSDDYSNQSRQFKINNVLTDCCCEL